MNKFGTSVVFGLILLVGLASAWWDSSWNYRVPVTITETSGSTLTDYQVLITIDTASLISAGKLQSDCSDIRFVDSDDATELSYWIEDGTCNTADTHIWVKVPSIPASSSKTIYMYYGNPTATSESSSTDTFIDVLTDVVDLYHMDEGTGTVVNDDAGGDDNGNLVNGGTWVTGKYGQAVQLDGTDDYIELVGAYDALEADNIYTISFWMYIDDYNGGSVVYCGDYDGNDLYYYFPSDGSYQRFMRNENYGDISYTISDGAWHFVTAVYGDASVDLYVDGSLAGSVGVSDMIDTSSDLIVGAYYNGNFPFKGKIDEFATFSDALTATQIQEIYENYLDYAGGIGFIRKKASSEPTTSVGSEETAGHNIYLSHTPDYPYIGDTVTLNVTFDSGDEPDNFTVNWGDSSSDTVTSVSTTNFLTHNYSDNGKYIVTVVGYYPDGTNATGTHAVRVWKIEDANATWWNDSWSHRFKVYWRNNGDINLTDVWAAVTINTTELIDEGYLDSNCRAIQGVGNTGTPLETSISGCGGEQTLYVKLDFLPVYTEQGFYVYINSTGTVANISTETPDTNVEWRSTGNVERKEIFVFYAYDITNLLHRYDVEDWEPASNYEVKDGYGETNSSLSVYIPGRANGISYTVVTEFNYTTYTSYNGKIGINPWSSDCYYTLSGNKSWTTLRMDAQYTPSGYNLKFYENGTLVANKTGCSASGVYWIYLHPDYSDIYFGFKTAYVYVYNSTSISQIQNFTVEANGHSVSTTDGQLEWNVSEFNLSKGDLVKFYADGYGYRQLYWQEEGSTTFYTDKDTEPTLHIDVRENVSADMNPNTSVQVWIDDKYLLYEGETDEEGYLDLVANPLRTYNLTWDSTWASWYVSYLIDDVLDELTNDVINATEENLHISLLNDSASVEYNNVSSVSITRGQVVSGEVPTGNDVTITVGGDNYPDRKYYVSITPTGRWTLQPRLLKYADAVLSKFIVEDSLQNVRSGAILYFRRIYGNSYEDVGQIKTDDAGQAQIFLYPYARYKLHVVSGSDIYDGEIEPQAITYYIILGNNTFGYNVKNNVQVRITPERPNRDSELEISVYDEYGALSWWAVEITDWQGNTIYTHNDTSSPSGGTIVLNLSEYPQPSTTFEYYRVHVSWERNSEFDPGFTQILYFNMTGTVGSLDYALRFGEENLDSGQRAVLAFIVILLVAGGVVVYLGRQAGMVVAMLMALVFAYYNWLPLVPVLLAELAGVMYYVKGRL
jgi:hypothetical protein